MKMTEPKQLKWTNSIALEYIYDKKGKKHLGKTSNNSLQLSKKHLGVAQEAMRINDDSPTFKTRPQGKRSVFEIFKQNGSHWQTGPDYVPSIFEVSNKAMKNNSSK